MGLTSAQYLFYEVAFGYDEGENGHIGGTLSFYMAWISDAVLYILHWIIEVKGLTGATGPLSCYCIWLRWKSNLKGSKAFETQMEEEEDGG